MKITSYEELDKLIAESLGWVWDLETEIGADFQQAETEWYHPPSIDIEFDDWIKVYGACPQFSTQDTKFILDECDYQDCVIELIRTKEATTCQIKPRNPELWTSKDFTPIIVGIDNIPNSMPLAICLAWLSFKGVKFELELPNETN